MNKAIKLALAAAILTIPTNAYAMPDQVPSFWVGLQQRMWSLIEDNRPCTRNITFLCRG